ncbi:hypothetical protein [Rhabdothermincola salaria]|uniref:hypothetical protein n=1 Tax=Rhabdothermincola salaria TaxID=2903142 RepID=UPI001E4ACDC0|nr:hypothetical protein [Rhabdothermincola salaria]MCD9623321.1 hypothetical protein [Rhabdothermincola salaria]
MSDAPGFAGVARRWGPDTVRVVLAEEAPLLRRQLLLALESHPRVVVVVEVADAEALVGVVVQETPDAVVVSAHLPPEGSGAAVVAARRAHPPIAAVVVDGGAGGAGSLPVPGVVHLSLDVAVTEVAAAVVRLVDARRNRPQQA